jgi:hypothetical protein
MVAVAQRLEGRRVCAQQRRSYDARRRGDPKIVLVVKDGPAVGRPIFVSMAAV